MLSLTKILENVNIHVYRYAFFIVSFVVRRLHPLPVGTLWMRFESNFTKDRKYALAKESGLGNGDFRVFSEQYALLSGGENMHFSLFLLLPTGINFF